MSGRSWKGEIEYKLAQLETKVENLADIPEREFLNVLLLDSVSVTTASAAIDVRNYLKKTIFVAVGATEAGTVAIQISPDGTTWWDYDSKTYEMETTNDSWEILTHVPYLRVVATIPGAGTVNVSAWIAARGS